LDDDGNLPLAFLLLGAGAVCAFMALRPWPQSGNKPIQPGAYAVDVLKGTPPPAGPQVGGSEVPLIETGLVTLFTIWALSKVGGWLSGIGGGAAPATSDETGGESEIEQNVEGDVTDLEAAG